MKPFLPFVPENHKQQLNEFWAAYHRESRKLGSVLSDDALWERFQLEGVSVIDDVQKISDKQLQADMKLLLAGKLSPAAKAQVQQQVARELAANSSQAQASSTTTSSFSPAYDQAQADRASMAAATARGESHLAAEREAARFENLPRDRREFRIEVATKASPDRERDPEVVRLREEHARLVRQGR